MFTGTESDMPSRFEIAAHLAFWESEKDARQHHRDSSEMYLAYTPWRSPDDYSNNIDALANDLVPEIPSLDYGILDIEAWPDVHGQDRAKIISDMVQVLKTPVEEANGDTER